MKDPNKELLTAKNVKRVMEYMNDRTEWDHGPLMEHDDWKYGYKRIRDLLEEARNRTDVKKKTIKELSNAANHYFEEEFVEAYESLRRTLESLT